MKKANVEQQTIQKLENTIHFLKNIINEIEQERKAGKKIKLWRGTKNYIDAALEDSKGQLKLAITEYSTELQEIQSATKKKRQA